MGILKAVGNAVKGGFADQWLEVIECQDMGAQTVFTKGVKTRQGQNTKGADNIVSNGSHIRVYDNQFMMLVDSGKVVDYTAEPGDYVVNNSSAPSLFNGQLGESLTEAFNRVRFGGENPQRQEVFFINLQEIKGIKFGTRNPINYFDTYYDAELFIRAHGTYSIKITNPLQFYAEVIPRNVDHVEIESINEQYVSEFLEGLQTAINQYSASGERVSFITSKASEVGALMSKCLDEKWNQLRGMEIQSVGIASISYDDESRKLLNIRNEGAMLKDASVREGYVQAAMARGVEAAGANANGATQGFMGMGMAMNSAGMMNAGNAQFNVAQMQMQQQAQTQQAQAQQMQQNQQGMGAAMAGAAMNAANGWTCSCGTVNTGKFCTECGKPAPAPAADGTWTCKCGTVNTGKFCFNCGSPRQ